MRERTYLTRANTHPGYVYNFTFVNDTGHPFPHRFWYMQNMGWPSGDNCYMIIRPYGTLKTSISKF